MSFQRLPMLESSYEIHLSSMVPKVEAPWQQHAVTQPLHRYQNKAGAHRNHMFCLATLPSLCSTMVNGKQPPRAYP